MKNKKFSVTALLIVIAVLISSCTPAADESLSAEQGGLDQSPIEETAPVPAVAEETPTMEESDADGDALPGENEENQAPAADTPPWFDVPLTDVRTGQTFTINEFKGRVILVETLAMWCSNCLKQQQQVKVLHETLMEDVDLVSIGLDIDINENASDLQAYTEKNGFDWLYVIAPVEVASEISNLYGAQFLNPPSTPILIIDRMGEVHIPPFGIKSADELLDFIEPFLSSSL